MQGSAWRRLWVVESPRTIIACTRQNQLISPFSTMTSRQKMSIPESSGKTGGRLLFYDEIRKFHVSDQTAQDVDVEQHTGRSMNCLYHFGMLAKYCRDNEYLLYGYR